MLRVIIRRHQKLQRDTAEVFERRAKIITARDFFTRWESYHRKQTNDATNNAIANVLHCDAERERIRASGREVLLSTSKISRRNYCQTTLVPAIESRLNEARRRRVFASFAIFCATRRRFHVLRAASLRLHHEIEKRTLLDAMNKWIRFVHERKIVHSLERFATASAKASDGALRSYYFSQWVTQTAAIRSQHCKQRAAAIIGTEGEVSLLHSLFTLWTARARAKLTAQVNNQLNDALDKQSLLEASLAEINHLFQRRNLLHEVEILISQKKSLITQKRSTIDSMKQQIAELESDLLEKQHNAKSKRELSLQEQVADLISVLKCRTINFASDVTLMGKAVEKCKKVGATRVFLEAHQAVKRVVVELTKKPYLPVDQEWPLTENKIAKLKSFHVDTILVAIKTMVITYDGMSTEQRMTLTSDQEIVVNARLLNLLADHCLAVKNKRFGRR